MQGITDKLWKAWKCHWRSEGMSSPRTPSNLVWDYYCLIFNPESLLLAKLVWITQRRPLLQVGTGGLEEWEGDDILQPPTAPPPLVWIMFVNWVIGKNMKCGVRRWKIYPLAIKSLSSLTVLKLSIQRAGLWKIKPRAGLAHRWYKSDPILPNRGACHTLSFGAHIEPQHPSLLTPLLRLYKMFIISPWVEAYLPSLKVTD